MRNDAKINPSIPLLSMSVLELEQVRKMSVVKPSLRAGYAAIAIALLVLP